MRGRLPEPAAAHEARGSRTLQRDSRKDEPKDTTEAPAKPDMGAEASAYWDEITPRLVLRRTLCLADGAALESLCREWGEYREAMKEIDRLRREKQKFVGEKCDHPRLIAKQAFERWLPLMREFGLSPVAKARVRAETNKKNDDDGKGGFFGGGMRIAK